MMRENEILNPPEPSCAAQMNSCVKYWATSMCLSLNYRELMEIANGTMYV